MADPDANAAPPPNLRVADSESKECGNCEHYQRGRCELPVLKDFVLPVDDSWVCDDWKAGGTDTNDQFKGKNLGEAEREALVRVRAHTRAKSASPTK